MKDQTTTYSDPAALGRNPLLPGFNPDPSIVQVDGVYYLVTSTFEYLPGLPVYRSTDLVAWTQVGNVLSRPEQADLRGVVTPGGVWAPTIRHHEGRYFVIVSVMFSPIGCVVFTATDPAGPWSEATSIPAVDGLDPDLEWDDDGKALVTFARMGQGIVQVEVDLQTGVATESPRRLWSGTGGHAPEGPHVFRHDDHWYLLVAEGGTERGHAVSIARGDSCRGPFVGYHGNPVLTARGTASPVQNVGHADLFETVDGRSALVCLGVRPAGFTRSFSPLGRETFITAIDWRDGWPIATLPQVSSEEPVHERYDFHDLALLDDPGWISVRRHPKVVGSTSVSPGSLTLVGDGSTLADPLPAFIGRRQQRLNSRFAAVIDCGQGTGGIAGRHAESHWFSVEAHTDGERVHLVATAALAGFTHRWDRTVPAGRIELVIESAVPATDAAAMAALQVGGDRIRLSAVAGGDTVVLAELDGRYWSFETTESFTGRVLGLFATNGTVHFSGLTIDAH